MRKRSKVYIKSYSDNEDTRKKVADDILENIKQRQETFDKEVSTLNDSEKQFKKASHILMKLKSDDKKKKLNN